MKVYKSTNLTKKFFSLIIETNENELCFADTEEINASVKHDAAIYLTFNKDKIEKSLSIVPELKYIPPIPSFSFLVMYPSTIRRLVYYIDGETEASIFEIQEINDKLFLKYNRRQVEGIEEVSSCVNGESLASVGIGILSAFAPGMIDKLTLIPPVLEDSLFSFSVNASIIKELYQRLVEEGMIKLDDVLLYFIGYMLTVMGRIAVKIPKDVDADVVSPISGALYPAAVVKSIGAVAKAYDENFEAVSERLKKLIDEVQKEITERDADKTMYI